MKVFLHTALRGSLAVAVLVALLGTGCAAGSAERSPAGGTRRMEPPVPNAALSDTPGGEIAVPLVGEAQPAAGQERTAARVKKRRDTLDPAMNPDNRASKSPSILPPPSLQMLHSTERNPMEDAEKGFTLTVPETVGTGEPFVIRLGGRGLRQVSVTWRDKTLKLKPVMGRDGVPVCEAALAVPLDAKARLLPLTLTAQWDSHTETMRAAIPVEARKYPVESLKVASRYVTPPAEVLEQIKRDRAVMGRVLGSVTPEQYWTLPMERPVPGAVGSVYGLRRVLNGKPRSSHKGLDFRAKAGDPVHSADAGVVVLAQEQYYGGNTVVVDHGLGVFTLYLHLSAFSVSPGQRVARGDVVGLIGSTGRSTGPHLHFSLSVLHDSVNPARFLEKTSK